MKPLRFTDGNVGWVYSSVKSFREKDVREFVLKNARKHLERMLQAEFRREVGCGRYKRTEKKNDQRNGYYRRALMTLYGWLEEIKVPRLRSGGWKSEVLGCYCRRSAALDKLILEGFLLGHSTRKTARQFKRAYAGSISPQGVSNVVKALNDEVEAFHKRNLGDDYGFIYLDGL